MDSLTVQYIILAVAFLFACWSIYRIIRKNFAPKKFSSKRRDCDKNCGC